MKPIFSSPASQIRTRELSFPPTKSPRPGFGHFKAKLFQVALVFGLLAAVVAFVGRHQASVKPAHQAQTNDLLQFTSSGHVLGFADNGVYVAAGSHALRVEFVDAHPSKPISTAAVNAAKIDKKAAPLSKVSYSNLWQGVTLTYDAANGAILRSTYRVEPHANADKICLRYNAPVKVQTDGSLRIEFQTGAAKESAPMAWQEREGKRIPVQIAFTTRGKDEIAFAVGQYDRSEPLFIDPSLTWNTFLGCSNDYCYGMAEDGYCKVYVSGL